MRKKIGCVVTMVFCSLVLGACASNETTEETLVEEPVIEAVEESVEDNTEDAEEAVVTEPSEDENTADETGDFTYTGDDAVLGAVTEYVCNEIGSYYEAQDYGIPVIMEIARDDSDLGDIKFYGIYQYETYILNGDTLESQAGGVHLGCMHVKATDAEYVVTQFDEVVDGSDWDESAKEIFGDNYDAMMKKYGDDEYKTNAKKQAIAEYVKSQGINATKYQDYGWDPVEF